MFDATKNFIIEPALIAQTDGCMALDAHQLPEQLFVSGNMRSGFVTIGIPFRFLQGRRDDGGSALRFPRTHPEIVRHRAPAPL